MDGIQSEGSRGPEGFIEPSRRDVSEALAMMGCIRILIFLSVFTMGQQVVIAQDKNPETFEETLFASLSRYERMHVGRVLQAQRLRLAAEPEGQIVTFVSIHRYPVFVRFEKVPLFLNSIHVLTKERVIKTEVLLKPGDTYHRNRLAETMRNLRELGILNLAAAVPVLNESGEFGILVVTRDLWSLRLESRFQTTGDFIDNFSMQLTERNLFGRGKKVSGRFELEPLTYNTGVSYLDPRIQGKKLALLLWGSTQFTRDENIYEGYDTDVVFYRPFYDLRQRWGFSLGLFRRDIVGRRIAQGQQLVYDDDETTDVIEALPMGWREKTFGGSAAGRVQLGQSFIWRLKTGAGASRSRFLTDELVDLSMVSEEVANRYRRSVLPVAQTLVYPSFGASFFQNRFHVFRNLAHFGFSEDVQVGPSGNLSVVLPREELGSTENQFIISGYLSWREAWLGSGLAELSGAFSTRRRASIGEFRDRKYLSRVRVASPFTRYGRLITRLDWYVRQELTTVSLVSLGGDNGLRGYSSEHFFSYDASRLRGNLEYRTPPRRWGSIRWGMVGFYDLGLLYDGTVFQATDNGPEELTRMPLAHTVGAGLRFVMPQASRFSYRVDLGVPLDGNGFMVTVTSESGQAVPMMPDEDNMHATDFSLGGLGNQR